MAGWSIPSSPELRYDRPRWPVTKDSHEREEDNLRERERTNVPRRSERSSRVLMFGRRRRCSAAARVTETLFPRSGEAMDDLGEVVDERDGSTSARWSIKEGEGRLATTSAYRRGREGGVAIERHRAS